MIGNERCARLIEEDQMLKKRFEHLRANKRAIGKLAIILIGIIIVVGTVVVTVVYFLGFLPLGRVVGSGDLVTEEKDFSDFTIVEVGSGFGVEIMQSSSYNINITADDNLLDYIEVFKTGETLTIRLKGSYSYQNVILRAEVTMPDLYELKFSGGTHGTVEGFTSSHEFILSLSGGSTISLEGAANNLRISASEGSHLYLSDFSVHDATVKLSGGSGATINLDGGLNANLSGGSKLRYIGDPTMGDINTSDGSTVSKK